MNRLAALEVASWRYPPPDERWTLCADDSAERRATAINDLLNPRQAYVAALDLRGSVVGVASSGPDATVRGGVYTVGAPRVVDVTARLRPSLLACGLGKRFLSLVLDWYADELAPRYIRATLPAADQRLQRLVTQLGFAQTWRFISTANDRSPGALFVQWERRVVNVTSDP